MQESIEIYNNEEEKNKILLKLCKQQVDKGQGLVLLDEKFTSDKKQHYVSTTEYKDLVIEMNRTGIDQKYVGKLHHVKTSDKIAIMVTNRDFCRGVDFC